MVRVAVVGAGFWGMNHARVLSEIPDSELVGICDIDIEKAKRAAIKYNAEGYYDDYEELIRKSRPEAVTICTPSTTHAALTIASLNKGLDVLVEKPMATSIEEAVRIMDVQRETGRNVMVGFVERFNPAVRFALKLVSDDEVGQVILSYSRRIGWWPERIGDVGVVKDTAVHDIDLTLKFFGGLPDTVFARAGRLRHMYEDHAQIFLTFGSGKSSIIEANWLTPRKKREMHITGERGVISVKFIEQEVTIEREDQLTVPNLKYAEPLRLELQHFISSVKDSSKPQVDSADGLRTTLIGEAILQSAETNRQIRLEDFVRGKGLENRYI